MKRLRPLGKKPEMAQNIAPEVKIAFTRDIFTAAIPLFENKDPSNPLPPNNPTTPTT